MADVPPGYVSAIRAAAQPRLDAPAWVFEGRTAPWAETLDRAARIAGGLQALGVTPGDRVAVLSANSSDYLALYLAVPWAGAVLVPLNSRWNPAENAFALDDCTPGVLFVSDDLVAPNAAMLDEYGDRITRVSLGGDRLGWTPLAQLLAADAVDDAGRNGDDLLAIFYTGGTTGRSKGVMLSHAGFLANTRAMREFGLFPDGCRALVVPPLFHLAAAAVLTMTMLGGSTAVIGKAFDPAGTLDLIAEEGVTDALLVPTMIQMILDAPGFDPARLTEVRTIMYGASPMQEATLDRIMAAAPHIDFVQAYGMTEVSCTATLLGADYHRGEHREAGRHRGAGKPMPIAQIVIADEAGNPLPAGEVGEILVRGAGVMLGYWNQPELTAQTLRGGWMHTGDGGRLDDHGILYVVDRIKDMIVSGGENIYSAEVEGALALHPAVAQVAVIGVPDARWGERVHAVILARTGAEVSEAALVAHCRERIAGYKCPRSIEFRTASLPLSAAGKILKAELRAPHWQGQTRNVG
ncbi:AMP-binding protein [Sphingomonas sp. MG17]|uniref:3-methylmercaptopropionyl-CoA ligase n=1 Tax=Sphingomonas tagetis TaxID=2949092 RepID=A0A9X2HQY5_9SPHN|nr:AMP-binding protein [Sphingomonas tagetis]MCP3730985.1 AMP-binding protein [Sphingomonas tagetis]